MTDIKFAIDSLHAEKRQLSSRIFEIDQAIYKLRLECPHAPEDLEIRDTETLERWRYDLAYSLDKTGERVIEKRHICCTVCGTAWTEMRYTDSEWLESREWEKQARGMV